MLPPLCAGEGVIGQDEGIARKQGELNSNSPLMRRYQAQLRLEKARVEDLLECPLTGEEYVGILVGNGELEP